MYQRPSLLSALLKLSLDLEPYQYQQLKQDTHEIRLVTLHPGQRSDPIRCRIDTIDIKKSPRYTAVSYTWATEDGDSSKSQIIEVLDANNSKPRRYLHVTKNCENVLRQLRSVSKERTIWIDSISIDQSLTWERNHQVRLMDRIYSIAWSVEICIWDPKKTYSGALEVLGGKTCLLSDISYRHQLKALFALRYFSRVWVIQEVLIAQQALLHVNEDMVLLDKENFKSLYFECIRRQFEVIRLAQWIRVFSKARGTPDLTYYLTLALDCSSTDPRDQVFAITSLLPQYLRCIIPIDYTAELQSVLVNAVTACVVEGAHLGLLCYCKLPAGSNDLSASTFGMAQLRAFLSDKFSARDALATPPLHRAVWAVHDAWLPNVVVVCKSRPCSQSTAYKWSIQHHSSVCDGFCESQYDVQYRHPKRTRVERIETTLPAHQVLPRMRVRAHFLDISYGTHQDQTVGQLILDMDACLDSLESTRWAYLADSFHDSHNNKSEAIAQVIGFFALEDTREARRAYIFRTESSVGSTHCHSMHGDTVVVVDGCQHPLLLRKIDEGEYRVVGKCYYWARPEVFGTSARRLVISEGDIYDEETRFIEIY